jgi:hypothetical protein
MDAVAAAQAAIEAASLAKSHFSRARIQLGRLTVSSRHDDGEIRFTLKTDGHNQNGSSFIHSKVRITILIDTDGIGRRKQEDFQYLTREATSRGLHPAMAYDLPTSGRPLDLEIQFTWSDVKRNKFRLETGVGHRILSIQVDWLLGDGREAHQVWSPAGPVVVADLAPRYLTDLFGEPLSAPVPIGNPEDGDYECPGTTSTTYRKARQYD